MEVTSQMIAGVALIRITGRIDHDRAAALEKALTAVIDAPAGEAATPLVLDMENVSFLTSAGLRVLMIVAKECKRRGRAIAVAGLQPMIAEIVRISRLDLVIPVYPSVDAVLNAFSRPAPGAVAEG